MQCKTEVEALAFIESKFLSRPYKENLKYRHKQSAPEKRKSQIYRRLNKMKLKKYALRYHKARKRYLDRRRKKMHRRLLGPLPKPYSKQVMPEIKTLKAPPKPPKMKTLPKMKEMPNTASVDKSVKGELLAILKGKITSSIDVIGKIIENNTKVIEVPLGKFIAPDKAKVTVIKLTDDAGNIMGYKIDKFKHSFRRNETYFISEQDWEKIKFEYEEIF